MSGEHESADRGQLVLLAAAAIAVALVPLALAYAGLGYHDDVGVEETNTPLADAERVVERITHNATSTVAGEYDWSQREQAAVTMGDHLDRDIERVTQSRLSSGVAYRIERNQSAAATWSAENCPRGPNRAFGSCAVIDGIVVQERAGEAAIVAVAFDIHATTERGQGELTVVVRPVSAAY